MLAEALILQIRADSLSGITRDLRIMAKESPDEALKKQLVADIHKTDKEAKSLQREADQKFIEAKNLKELNEGRVNRLDSMVEVANVINDISIYQYTSGIANEVSNDNQVSSVANKTDDFIFLEKIAL